MVAPSAGERGIRPKARRVALGVVGAAAVCGVMLVSSTAGAEAHKVTLCHATDSVTNPYVSITVDYHSIEHKGHGGHEGPVYFPGIEGKWGDVIPSYDFGDGHAYPGMNLADGQALLDSGCTTVPDTTTTVIEA